MKAADRCREMFQGDRCKKERSHDLSVAQEPDEVHEGKFTQWTGDGDSQRVLGKAKGAVPRVFRAGLRKAKKLHDYALRVEAGVGGRGRAIAILNFVQRGLADGK